MYCMYVVYVCMYDVCMYDVCKYVCMYVCLVGYGPDLVAEVAEELSSSLRLADDALIPRSGYNIHTHTPSYVCMYVFIYFKYICMCGLDGTR